MMPRCLRNCVAGKIGINRFICAGLRVANPGIAGDEPESGSPARLFSVGKRFVSSYSATSLHRSYLSKVRTKKAGNDHPSRG